MEPVGDLQAPDRRNQGARLRNESEHPPALARRVVIQYGGSVKPENVGKLLHEPDVDGALVGGASLNADMFLAIVRAAG